MATSTRAALASFAELVELPLGSGGPAAFLAAFAPLARGLDAAFDMTALALTGREAPGLPVLAWTLGNLPRGAGLLASRRRSLKTTDTLLVSSTADLAILERTLGGSGPHGRRVPFGVDEEAFRPAAPGERERARHELGVPPDAFLLVYAGRLNVQKNLHALLALLARLAPRIPSLHLAVAGAEDRTPLPHFGVDNRGYTERLREQARRSGVAARVRWTGALADGDLAALLRAGDLFVSFSLHIDENFGYAPVEAMASGVPALVTDWGGYRDSVPHGGPGWRVPTLLTRHGLRACWRRALPLVERLAAAPDLARRAGERARRHVERELGLLAFRRNLRAAVVEAAGRRDVAPRFGDEAFRFHPLALRHQARNALRHLERERTGGRLDLRVRDEDYDLYRFFVAPYATADVCEVAALPGDRPAPLVETRAGPRGVAGLDPIWPVEVAVERGRAELLLAADGERSVAELARTSGEPLERLLADATELARAGLVDLGRPYPFERVDGEPPSGRAGEQVAGAATAR